LSSAEKREVTMTAATSKPLAAGTARTSTEGDNV
jgi:hypothetical protein